MSEEITPINDVLNIYAHQSHVEDLSERFMVALRAAMIDKSYGNDDSASFAAKHADDDKMYHLWIDHLDVEQRCENDEHRFFLQVYGLSNGYSENKDNFIDYMDICSCNEVIIITNSEYALAQELCKILPEFNKSYLSQK
jgi:hypothetical protein